MSNLVAVLLIVALASASWVISRWENNRSERRVREMFAADRRRVRKGPT
jgi:uncharacterized membrane protein YqjE